MPGYGLSASPSVYPGQVVRALVEAGETNVGPITAGLYLRYYGANDALVHLAGPSVHLAPGIRRALTWRLTDMAATPIAEMGVELSATQRSDGTVYLDHLTWDGAPDTVFERPAHNGTLWRQAWVDAVDHFQPNFKESFRLAQDEGTGLLITGTREWTDYEASATITPFLLAAGGLAARVQGLRRYYALLLGDDQYVRLVKALDGERVLAEAELPVAWGRGYALRLRVRGTHLEALVDQQPLFAVEDTDQPLLNGGIGLVVREGALATEAVRVRPIDT